MMFHINASHLPFCFGNYPWIVMLSITISIFTSLIPRHFVSMNCNAFHNYLYNVHILLYSRMLHLLCRPLFMACDFRNLRIFFPGLYTSLQLFLSTHIACLQWPHPWLPMRFLCWWMAWQIFSQFSRLWPSTKQQSHGTTWRSSMACTATKPCFRQLTMNSLCLGISRLDPSFAWTNADASSSNTQCTRFYSSFHSLP